jgi:hypothetical protein
MSSPANALAVLINPVPGQDEAFNEWYANVHIPDILAIPSFVSVQRFAFAEGKPASITHTYMTIYELAGTAEEAIADLTAAFHAGKAPVDRSCCDAASIQLLPLNAI